MGGRGGLQDVLVPGLVRLAREGGRRYMHSDDCQPGLTFGFHSVTSALQCYVEVNFDTSIPLLPHPMSLLFVCV